MATYVYEVINKDGSGGERFELVQPMSDDPIKTHPETNQPVRRVIQPFQITGAASLIAGITVGVLVSGIETAVRGKRPESSTINE